MENKEGSVKQKIIQHLKNFSENCQTIDFLIEENLGKCTANIIAKELDCSRNLVSHYFNELLQEGQLIKVNSRPTYFFDKLSLCNALNTKSIQSEFDSLEELRTYLQVNHRARSNAFKKLVGATESLAYAIEQCKAAITYPDGGLPILLQGQTGTGKSFIAQLMFDYAQEKKIIDKESKFVIVNCAEYSNNPELLMTNLFGYVKGAFTGADSDTDGILAQADGGIIFLDEVHSLKPDCQEKIFLYMDKGTYHKVGDNKKWYKGQCRMIFATTEDPNAVLLKTFMRRIPITVKIPSLAERSMHEKNELIHTLFKYEEQRIKKTIRLSKLTYQALISFEYKGNVGQMKNMIKAAVANVYIQSLQRDSIEIRIDDLPEDMFNGNLTDVTNQYDDNSMIELDSILRVNYTDSKIYLMNQSIIKHYTSLDMPKQFSEFIDFVQLRLDQYYDYLFFESTKNSPKLKLMENLMTNIINILINEKSVQKISNNQIRMLSIFIYDFSKEYGFEWSLIKSHAEDINSLMNYVKNEFTSEWEIVSKIVNLVDNSMHINLGAVGSLDLFFIMHRFNRILSNAKIPGVILAHGYSIASGIVEVTNQFLNHNIFEAIDMPLETDFQDVIEKLVEYLKRFENLKEIIVMVDMGSLESVHQFLETFANIDIGIINNVSTKLALDIGSMIMEGYSIEKILEEASERNKHKYKIIKNRKKQPAIITVCETGIGTAEKFADLLKNSFPSNAGVTFIPYDYASIEEKKKSLPVFDKYNVLCMIGTSNPHIENVKFIPIEGIINGSSYQELEQLSRNHLNEKDLENFKKAILRNFSMDNLLNYLTILNSERIVVSVEAIIDKIQTGLKLELNSNVVFGLYIHIGCLIERLIIDKYMVNFEGLAEFVDSHQDFIIVVKNAFEEIEQMYNVTVPLSEIGYIYNYIFKRYKASVKEDENSVNDLWTES